MKMRQTKYDQSVEADREQERKRQLMYDMQDYADRKDTPGARMVAEVLERVRADKVRGALLGDPLRLRPDHKKIADQERKEAEREKAKAAKKKKKNKSEPEPLPATPIDAVNDEEVPHPQSPWLGRQIVKSRGYSRRYLEPYQETAINQFERDYEGAFGDSLRGSQLTEKVDASASDHQLHIRKLEAQERMRMLKGKIGDRGFRILEAVVIGSVTPTEIQSASGGKVAKTHITAEIRDIAHNVAVFYGSKRDQKDTILVAIDRVAIKRADDMIRDAERSLMENRQPTAAGRSSAA